jgi:hypothetical protein
LNENSIADGIFEALLKTPEILLSELKSFEGSGIYSIYYDGNHPAYSKISRSNSAPASTSPIYIGKASTKGARTGFIDDNIGNSLYRRLKDHSASIAATDLKVEDFRVKFLVLKDMWIHLAETAAITRSKPVWNTILDGFGNHNPGSGRLKGVRPMWDTLHPGRPWAMKLPERQESPEKICELISIYFNEAA